MRKGSKRKAEIVPRKYVGEKRTKKIFVHVRPSFYEKVFLPLCHAHNMTDSTFAASCIMLSCQRIADGRVSNAHKERYFGAADFNEELENRKAIALAARGGSTEDPEERRNEDQNASPAVDLRDLCCFSRELQG